MAMVTRLFEVEFTDTDGSEHKHMLDENEVRSLIWQCCEALEIDSPVEDPYAEDESGNAA